MDYQEKIKIVDTLNEQFWVYTSTVHLKILLYTVLTEFYLSHGNVCANLRCISVHKWDHNAHMPAAQPYTDVDWPSEHLCHAV
jgi:hypothetical protein